MNEMEGCRVTGRFWFHSGGKINLLDSPDKCEFLQSPVNVIDLVATLSFYTDMLLQASSSS